MAEELKNTNTSAQGKDNLLKERPIEKSSIDSLNERLYSRDVGENPRESNSSSYVDKTMPVDKDWAENISGDQELPDRVTGAFMKRKKTFLKAFVYSAGAFFLVSVAIALFVFLGGRNQVSSENIIIELKSNRSTPAGKVFDYGITIQNNNRVSLEKSNITITYPLGTRDPIDPRKELLREQKDMGLITGGQIVRDNFKAILYGDKGEKKNINISYEYNVPGSNSSFEKKQSFEIEIDASPVVLEISMSDEYTSGQNISAEVLVSSNTDEVVKDLMLIAEYPFGFDFKSSVPDASFGREVWYLGSISPNEKKKITILGTITGATSDERTIRFKLGVRDSQNVNDISSLVTETGKTYKIKNPLLGIVLSLNGRESGDYITTMGSSLLGDVTYWNNTDITIENGVIEVSIPDKIVNEKSIRANDGGFYNSSNRKIVWDRNSTTFLRSIPPGGYVKVSFEMGTLPMYGNSIVNPQFSLTATGIGERTDGKITGDVTRVVKMNSQLVLSGASYYSGSNIQNTGPLPPKVNKKTSYTVTLSLTNTNNPLSRVLLNAKLPPYVEWDNVVYPSSERVSFDSNSRTVTWIVGQMSPGVGQSSSPKEVSFKVTLIPSITQIGMAPALIEGLLAEAIDDFTGTNLTSAKASVTTLIQNDPLYVAGYENVID